MAIEKLNIFPPTLVHSYFTIQLIHDKLQIMIQYDTYSQIEYAVHTEYTDRRAWIYLCIMLIINVRPCFHKDGG